MSFGPPRDGAWSLHGGPLGGNYLGWRACDAGLPEYGFHRWFGYQDHPMHRQKPKRPKRKQ